MEEVCSTELGRHVGILYYLLLNITVSGNRRHLSLLAVNIFQFITLYAVHEVISPIINFLSLQMAFMSQLKLLTCHNH
jgi:hypothetical protein